MARCVSPARASGVRLLTVAQRLRRCAGFGVEQIDLWQLHRTDPRVPRDEQFGAVRRLLDDGIIRHAGLSEVSVADIEALGGISGGDGAEPLQPHGPRQ